MCPRTVNSSFASVVAASTRPFCTSRSSSMPDPLAVAPKTNGVDRSPVVPLTPSVAPRPELLTRSEPIHRPTLRMVVLS